MENDGLYAPNAEISQYSGNIITNRADGLYASVRNLENEIYSVSGIVTGISGGLTSEIANRENADLALSGVIYNSISGL
jgi:hypothetical protein